MKKPQPESGCGYSIKNRWFECASVCAFSLGRWGLAAFATSSGCVFCRCFGGFFGLTLLFFLGGQSLLSFLLGLGLVGIVAGLALQDIGCVEEASNAVCRLRPNGQPMLDALGVEFYAILGILWQHRVIGADALDVAAITGGAGIGCDNVIIGPFLRAAAGEPDFD